MHSGSCIKCEKQSDNPSGLQHDQILPSSTALWNACRTLALEISTLRELGVLHGEVTKVEVEPPSVHATLRTHRCGGRVLMLVNTLNQYSPFTAPVPTDHGSSEFATALFENRRVPMPHGDQLQDTISPPLLYRRIRYNRGHVRPDRTTRRPQASPSPRPASRPTPLPSRCRSP